MSTSSYAAVVPAMAVSAVPVEVSGTTVADPPTPAESAGESNVVPLGARRGEV